VQEFFQQIINGLALGSIYALIALGYTMVYGILKMINFAHGDLYMLSAITGYYAAHALHVHEQSSTFGFISVFLISVAVSTLAGLLIERIAYRPLRQAPRLSLLITAIGISLFLEFGGQVVFGPDPKLFPPLIQVATLWQWGGLVITNIQILILAVTGLLLLCLWWTIHHTRMGKAMRAVAFNLDAAQLMGIHPDRIIAFTFAVGSALAGAAGILVGISIPKIEPLMGIMPGLKAFVAAVLGGIGNITGAVVGGLFIGLAETLIVGYTVSTYRDAIAFIILILILLIRPTGLLGSGEREKV